MSIVAKIWQSWTKMELDPPPPYLEVSYTLCVRVFAVIIMRDLHSPVIYYSQVGLWVF